MKIKICGIRREEDVQYLNELRPDFAGFVFADTRRKVTGEQAVTLRRQLDSEIPVFGVFVNAPKEQVAALAEDGTIQVIQLHGDESEEYICDLRSMTQTPIIKAVRVQTREDVIQADRLLVDGLLLDTFQKGTYGGTGQTFAWDMIPRDLKHPYILAGGLDSNNLERALAAVQKRGRCEAFDVSGGVETDGVKDYYKIKEMIQMIRAFDQ